MLHQAELWLQSVQQLGTQGGKSNFLKALVVHTHKCIGMFPNKSHLVIATLRVQRKHTPLKPAHKSVKRVPVLFPTLCVWFQNDVLLPILFPQLPNLGYILAFPFYLISAQNVLGYVAVFFHWLLIIIASFSEEEQTVAEKLISSAAQSLFPLHPNFWSLWQYWN